MKRRELIRHLETHGCEFLREGSDHTVYVNRAAKNPSSFPVIARLRMNLSLEGSVPTEDAPDSKRHDEDLSRLVFSVKRVCLTGAECTGKSTIAESLAKHYRTVWVPEYARTYLEDRGGKRLSPSIMIPIALGQLASEQAMVKYANRVLICDTNLLSTPIWSERYFGGVDEIVLDLANHCSCDLYLLADIDIPWIDDGLRDSFDCRESMHKRFLSELTTRRLRFVMLSGTFEERMATAVRAVNSLLGL